MASVLDLIGETPLIEITKFDCGPCRLFLKFESANPSGSIKDRPARFMIEAAENDGRLKPGGTIVEATAGNTGLGLALVGGRKGYRIVLVVPDKMAREKIQQCKAMGAEVVLTRSDVGRGHPDSRPPSKRARLPTPVPTKAGPMPTNERLWTDDRDDPQNRRKPSIQLDKEYAIAVRKPDAPMHYPAQHNHLVPEHSIFGFKSARRLKWRDQDVKDKA